MWNNWRQGLPWQDYHPKNMDKVIYIDREYQFDNLYYIYNALAIRRKLNVIFAPVTEQGNHLELYQHAPKFKCSIDALNHAIKVEQDFRTDRGKLLLLSPNPHKIIPQTLLEALNKAIKDGILTKANLKELDDGTDNFAKEAFNLLYTECLGTDRLWANVPANVRQTFLKGLRVLFANDKIGKA